jgi:hypothetical protein
MEEDSGQYICGSSVMVASRPDRSRSKEPPSDDTDLAAELWLSAPRSAARYRTAAARARVLQAATTTTRLRRYLEEMIARYEERAVDLERSKKA